jgi:hypothetical protein
MHSPPDFSDPRVMDELVERIARRVVELQGLVAPKPVLTISEAIEFVRLRSRSSLDRWCRRFASNARCGHGRYTRAALATGLEKEARCFVSPRVNRRRGRLPANVVAPSD